MQLITRAAAVVVAVVIGLLSAPAAAGAGEPSDDTWQNTPVNIFRDGELVAVASGDEAVRTIKIKCGGIKENGARLLVAAAARDNLNPKRVCGHGHVVRVHRTLRGIPNSS